MNKRGRFIDLEQLETVPSGWLASAGFTTKAAAGDEEASPMKEILITKSFIKSLSLIRGEIITAYDDEMSQLMHMCIDQSEVGATEYITDEIQVATFGSGMELSVYFMTADRLLGKGENRVIIRKYAFLLALADDVYLPRLNQKLGPSKPSKSATLKSVAKVTAVSMAVLRTIVQVVKEYSDS